jgi:hypothetical protein
MTAVTTSPTVLDAGTASALRVVNTGDRVLRLWPAGGRVAPGGSVTLEGTRGVPLTATVETGTGSADVVVLASFPDIDGSSPDPGDSNGIPAGSVTLSDLSQEVLDEIGGGGGGGTSPVAAYAFAKTTIVAATYSGGAWTIEVEPGTGGNFAPEGWGVPNLIGYVVAPGITDIDPSRITDATDIGWLSLNSPIDDVFTGLPGSSNSLIIPGDGEEIPDTGRDIVGWTLMLVPAGGEYYQTVLGAQKASAAFSAAVEPNVNYGVSALNGNPAGSLTLLDASFGDVTLDLDPTATSVADVVGALARFVRLDDSANLATIVLGAGDTASGVGFTGATELQLGPNATVLLYVPGPSSGLTIAYPEWRVIDAYGTVTPVVPD